MNHELHGRNFSRSVLVSGTERILVCETHPAPRIRASRASLFILAWFFFSLVKSTRFHLYVELHGRAYSKK